MNIRKMTLQDYEHVKWLWDESGLSDEPEDQAEEIDEFLRSTQSSAFVAEEKERIVGAVLCGSDGRYGYIHHLAVADHKRNHGIGRSLVQACVTFLNKRHVLIMVRENNERGREFWRRLAFCEVDGLKIQYIKLSL